MCFNVQHSHTKKYNNNSAEKYNNKTEKEHFERINTFTCHNPKQTYNFQCYCEWKLNLPFLIETACKTQTFS